MFDKILAVQYYMDMLTANDHFGILRRSLRTNCLPFFIALIAIIAYLVLDHTAGDFVRLMYKALTCKCLRGGVKVVEEKFIPPYTSVFRYVLYIL